MSQGCWRWPSRPHRSRERCNAKAVASTAAAPGRDPAVERTALRLSRIARRPRRHCNATTWRCPGCRSCDRGASPASAGPWTPSARSTIGRKSAMRSSGTKERQPRSKRTSTALRHGWSSKPAAIASMRKRIELPGNSFRQSDESYCGHSLKARTARFQRTGAIPSGNPAGLPGGSLGSLLPQCGPLIPQKSRWLAQRIVRLGTAGLAWNVTIRRARASRRH